MKQRALLIVNYRARQGHKTLELVTEQLRELDFDLIEAPTPHPRKMTDTIGQYRDRVDLVIIGGGDGTLNAAIEGLVKTQLPLGILPLGTANDLARTLGIPIDPLAACQTIAAGQQQRIDVGCVNGRYFFNVASLGLSVQVTRNLDTTAKRRWGVFAYGMTALQVLAHSRPFVAQLRIDDGEWQTVKTIQIAVGNGRYYGGGLTVTEDATIDDQRLDVYSLNLKHWWQILALLPAMRFGNHTSWSFVDSFRCQEIEIRTNRPYAINTDGEIKTSTPAHFRVIPRALSVVIPQSAKDGAAKGLKG